ncbi:nucleotidyltransferase domain-containing protein [Pedobacter gandavensis]|uniref:nucleotidyltransferase domain-containing protein n=1 Tax=Pedobacter gandavensis TaxID=2679963 RepID=UPI00292D51F4|nr:nucleotidyltransferase domain-containing protein [Pedobacter gandavensis]
MSSFKRTTMKTRILNQLQEIETNNQLKILYACESGSRGWQFPSPDSDFDVRFIYIRSANFYLSVAEKQDHLGFPINDELDIYGWDLKKVLQLTAKSNTTPFEWLQSPIVYSEVAGFRSELWALCQHFFSQRINTNHYLGIGKSAMSTITDNNEISIKKLFYVLRPLLAAKWCLEKNGIAAMTIDPLLELMPQNLQEMVQDLVIFKTTTVEALAVKIDEDLKNWIEREFELCSEAVKIIEQTKFDYGLLDTFFLKMIKAYDN